MANNPLFSRTTLPNWTADPMAAPSRLMDVGDQISNVPEQIDQDTDPIVKRVLDLYSQWKPQTAATQALSNMIQQFPQRTPPSRLQNILGTLASFGGAHAATYGRGGPMGFRGPSPEEMMQAGDLIRYRPYYEALQDWQTKLKPLEAIAQQERYYNTNLRQLLGQETARFTGAENVASLKARREAQTEQAKEDAQIKWWNATINYNKLSQGDWSFVPDNQGVMRAYDRRDPTDSGRVVIDPDTLRPATSSKLPDAKRIEMETTGRIRVVQAQTQGRIAGIITQAQVGRNWPQFTDDHGNNYAIDPFEHKAWLIQRGEGPMPTGPANIQTPGQPQVPSQAQPQIQPQVQPQGRYQGPPTGTGIPGDVPASAVLTQPTAAPAITAPQQAPTAPRQAAVPGPLGPLTKAGAKQLTGQTATMQEGAQMMLPDLPKLRRFAYQLNQAGWFGPIMSRARELAEKLGTSGDPGKDQQMIYQLSDDLANDPQMNPSTGNLSTDRLIGRFSAMLALVASGTGRVHGGARGGGSIQMIQYLKQVLSAKSSYEMFEGRLDTLEDKLRTYAMGPKAAQYENEQRERVRKALQQDLRKQ